MSPEQQSGPLQTVSSDLLTANVKDKLRDFLWAALEAQAQRDTAMQALARATVERQQANERIAELEKEKTEREAVDRAEDVIRDMKRKAT